MTFEEAVAVYARSDAPRRIYQQPSKALSTLTHGVWYLRNVRGLLVRVGTKSKAVSVDYEEA